MQAARVSGIEDKLEGLDELKAICRYEGWSLAELAELLHFDAGYHRNGKGMFRFKFPPTVKFALLKANKSVPLRFQEWEAHYSYVLGLQRTDNDPKSGKLECHWDYSGKVKNNINDVTAFAWIFYYPKSREVALSCIQSTVIDRNDVSNVTAELARMPISSTTVERMVNLIEHRVPWAYADRVLLFAPVAMHIADRLGAETVSFAYIRRERHESITRAYDFANRHVVQNRLRLELIGMQ